MAKNLGLQTASSDLGCSFSGNFESLIRLRNHIEWLMFHQRGAVPNTDEHLEESSWSGFLHEEPLDYTAPNVNLKSQKESALLSEKFERIYPYAMVSECADEVSDSSKMDGSNKSDVLTRCLKFKPELVEYANHVHSVQIDEIRQTCYVSICTKDDGNVEISLSDSVPGTETDVENAVDLLRLLFSDIDRGMSMQYFDLGTFNVNDDFRSQIQTQLMSIAAILVVRQPESCVLQVYGKTEVIEDALVKAQDLLVKEVEREKALQAKIRYEMEMAQEAERREKEAREEERRVEQAQKAELEAREAQRRDTIAQEEQRREALSRDAERKNALQREADGVVINNEQAMSKEIVVQAVTIPQTNSLRENFTVQNPTSQEQPLPPPSTGDDWAESEIIDQKMNGESSQDVSSNDIDGPVEVGPSVNNGIARMKLDQQREPADRNSKNLQLKREDTSPTSTLRPLNSRFHEFISRNFFNSTSSSGQANLYDTIFNGVHITVKRGDIAKEPAAIIVSSNDVELSCGGALSSTIDKASGSIIHAKCLEWKKAYGIPVEGQIVEIDSDGVLPCNKVFFIVMPSWNADQDQTYLESQLRQSCKNILQKARDTRNVSSVAIPGLGTGKFYFPCDVYARIMTDALKEFLQAKGRMLEIRFIDLDFRVLQALQREFQSRLKHPEKASDDQSLSEIYRQTTDNGEPLPTGFVERTPPSGFERIFRRQISDPNNREREQKWVKKFRSLSTTAVETKFESCILCTRRVSVGFFGYIPCKHIVCHICLNEMELHEKRACPTCFKSFSKLQISKF
ncbi:uncharacterized protein LOC117107437 [Anneissia japonica]|uniref:uncharacterized protein LOC117107437 n=1 Tax=Anneissia japonica TaxID=1529436 RepID=UPI0014258449|nr:uncharacterized protein LOC117107437 [Anneissia japonica]